MLSSIGKKILMSLTGIMLLLFLFAHLSGNLLLYIGKAEFNAYANLLNSTKLIYIAEVALLLIFVVHILTAIKLTQENKKAKGFAESKDREQKSITWTASYMVHSGMITLIFVIIHLVTFKWGNWDNSEQGKTLYDLVALLFSDIKYSLFYIVCMIFLGFHLNHAFSSALQTLGITAGKSSKLLRNIGAGMAIVLSLGFISFPIYFYSFN